ncbi:hypothetical protein VTO73DRAFT_10573 [Trametes versicolor]
MGDLYSDMPNLVDPGRRFGEFDGPAPQPLPMGVGIPSPYFPYEQQRGPPPSSYMQHSHSYSTSSGSSGYPWSTPSDSQASTLTPWSAATPFQSMPATPAPMFSGPAVAAMHPFVPVSITPDGFPRSPPDPREQEDDRRGSLSRRPSLRGPGAEASKRPPRDWRSDFSMNGPGFLGNLLTRSRSKSFVSGDFLQPKVTLNAYIRYVSNKPPMHYDLRRDANSLRFRALEHHISRWDLTRFACEPPLLNMRLVHAQLPWYIDVEADTNPTGVTLFDLFCAIQNSMLSPISFSDFYNIEMTNDLRDQIAASWAERCRTEAERNRGVFKVDYLMGKVIMEGITKGRDGLWEIKTRKL